MNGHLSYDFDVFLLVRNERAKYTKHEACTLLRAYHSTASNCSDNKETRVSQRVRNNSQARRKGQMKHHDVFCSSAWHGLILTKILISVTNLTRQFVEAGTDIREAENSTPSRQGHTLFFIVAAE